MKVIEGTNLYGLLETCKLLKVNSIKAISILEEKEWLYRSSWVSNRDLKDGRPGKGKLLPCAKYTDKYFICLNMGGSIIVQTYVTEKGVKAMRYLFLAEGLITEEES